MAKNVGSVYLIRNHIEKMYVCLLSAPTFNFYSWAMSEL